MTDIIITRLEKRLRKVETKVVDMKDHYEEMDNNLEDLYDTINNHNTNNNTYNLKSLDKNDTCPDTTCPDTILNNKYDKDILKFIKNINNINNTTLEQHVKEHLKEQATEFYNKLKHNQPQLSLTSIKEHITYFIEQNHEQRLIILDSLISISSLSDTKVPKVFKILNSNLDTYHKKIAMNKLQILETMLRSDNEYFKLSQWLDTFLEIPFNKYKTPSYLDEKIIANPGQYLLDSKKHLDTVIYGQDKTKQHIIEIIGKMITNPKTFGSVFAIYGEPGTGKTTLIQDGLSHIFGLPFIFISLGGAQDRATLAGSNYVYEGSACGKIIQSLKQTQCMNPIFYFDELDKISETEKGNEIVNLLVHLTDYTQNSHFMDDYMDGIAIDLSRTTFVFSFNDKTKISPVLLDRMEVIKFNSYSVKEKVVISREFLLPSIMKNIYNDKSIKVNISDKQLERIVMNGGSGRVSNGGVSSGRRICRSNINRCKSNLGKIMKNVSRHKKYSGGRQILNYYSNNYNNYNTNNTSQNVKNMNMNNRKGGVRYIKKILERIISRINVDMMISKNNKKRKSNSNSNSNSNHISEITIADKNINDVLNDKI